MKSTLKFAVQHIKKHPIVFGSTLFAGFINSCASFLLPVSIGDFFALYYHTGSTKGKLLTWLGFHFSGLPEFYLFFICILFIKFATGIYEKIQTFRLGECFVKDLRERIFSAQMHWRPELLTSGSYGKYLLRYSNDMKAVQNYFTKGLLEGIRHFFFLGTGIFFLARINGYLTSVFLFLTGFVGVIVFLIAKMQVPLITAARTYRSSLLAHVTKSFSRIQKIKDAGNEGEIISVFEARSSKLYSANMASNKLESLLDNISGFLIFLVIGVLLWQMTIPSGSITSGEGLMMILIILMFQGTLRKVLKIPGYLNKGQVSLDKIAHILNQLNTVEHPLKEVVGQHRDSIFGEP